METILRGPYHSLKQGQHVKKAIFGFLAALVLAVTGGCALNMSLYSDGSLTDYLHQPIPKLEQPLAATLSLNVVSYQTAASMKGIMVSDLSGGEIIILPKKVGIEVKKLLQLDNKYSEEATYKALNAIAKARVDTRARPVLQTLPTGPAASSASNRYVEHYSQQAREAYRKGDYLSGDIYNTAAANRIMIDQSFASAQSAVNLTFAVTGAMAAAGRAIIKKDFRNLHNWLVTGSGAIGPEVSKDRHLGVFFFRFFDAKPFRLDSRMRVAVMLTLTDKNGIVKTVLEGSDVLNCSNECNIFTPKATALPVERATHSEDVKNQWSKEGLDYIYGNGFDVLGGLYQYFLLEQGLRKLQAAIQE